MRINIVSDTRGVLETSPTINPTSPRPVSTAWHQVFPVESIFDWYPLNPQYVLTHSKSTGQYSLQVDAELLVKCDYGVPLDQSKAISLPNQEGQWFNLDIREANEAVFAFARQLGVVTPEDSFNLATIDEGFVTFHQVMDGIHKVALIRYTALTEEEKQLASTPSSCVERQGETFYEYAPHVKTAIRGGDEETRLELVLATLTKEEEDLYFRLGEVYTMLCMMRKIVMARG